jgi:hypothetical protein
VNGTTEAVHTKDLGIHLAKDLGISVPKEFAKDSGIRLAKGGVRHDGHDIKWLHTPACC